MKKGLAYLLMATLIVGSLTACRREPYNEDELNRETKKAENYLEKKYPGHDFTVTVENELCSGMGIPTYYALEIRAEDENGKKFTVWHSPSGDDTLIFQFFVKHWDDNYSEE